MNRVFTGDIVSCEQCGQNNRLPVGVVPQGKKVICASCKADLFTAADFDDDDTDDDDDV